MTPRPGSVFHDVPHHDHPGPCTIGHACLGDLEVISAEWRGGKLAVDWQDPEHPTVTGVSILDGAA